MRLLVKHWLIQLNSLTKMAIAYLPGPTPLEETINHI